MLCISRPNGNGTGQILLLLLGRIVCDFKHRSAQYQKASYFKQFRAVQFQAATYQHNYHKCCSGRPVADERCDTWRSTSALLQHH